MSKGELHDIRNSFKALSQGAQKSIGPFQRKLTMLSERTEDECLNREQRRRLDL